MHSSFLKQVAYSQRIFRPEDEISAINAGLSGFLIKFSTNPSDQVVICVNASEQMKRHEQAIAGQLWMQSDRMMSEANVPLPGMANSTESALLTAVVEAVEWKHPLELPYIPRSGQWKHPLELPPPGSPFLRKERLGYRRRTRRSV
jgi:hypothetical protein